MILDDNLVNHAARPENPGLRRPIAARSPAVSAISVVEVLQYHLLTAASRTHFERFSAVVEVLPLNEAVLSGAMGLRQHRKMSLGDALVGATALVSGRELLTSNVKDFAGIPGLVVTDPLRDCDPN